jgi:hypothetical protein
LPFLRTASSDVLVPGLDWAAAQMYGQADVMEEPQAWSKISDDCGRLMPRPREDRRCSGLVVVLQEAGEKALIGEAGLNAAAGATAPPPTVYTTCTTYAGGVVSCTSR